MHRACDHSASTYTWTTCFPMIFWLGVVVGTQRTCLAAHRGLQLSGQISANLERPSRVMRHLAPGSPSLLFPDEEPRHRHHHA